MMNDKILLFLSGILLAVGLVFWIVSLNLRKLLYCYTRNVERVSKIEQSVFNGLRNFGFFIILFALGSFLYISNGSEINMYVNIIYILVILSIFGYSNMVANKIRETQ